MKIYVVYNRPREKGYWLTAMLKNYFASDKIDVIPICPSHKASDYRKYGRVGWIAVQLIQLKIAVLAIRKAKDDDVIIADVYPLGKWCSILAGLFGRNQKILAFNCLQYKKSKMDRLVWRNTRLITTVNAFREINKLGIPENVKKERNIYFYPDTYLKKEPVAVSKMYDGMTGGYANRDFSTFFELAKHNKEKNFICVVGSLFQSDQYEIPENVTVLQDIGEEDFAKVMNQSKVILLPLLDNSVAGLVMLKDAISYHVPFVVSQSDAIINYIPRKFRDMVVAQIKDVDDFEVKFNNIYQLSDNWESNAKEMEAYAQQWCPEKKIQMIVEILKKEKFI